jgi:hypothetical protein
LCGRYALIQPPRGRGSASTVQLAALGALFDCIAALHGMCTTQGQLQCSLCNAVLTHLLDARDHLSTCLALIADAVGWQARAEVARTAGPLAAAVAAWASMGGVLMAWGQQWQVVAVVAALAAMLVSPVGLVASMVEVQVRRRRGPWGGTAPSPPAQLVYICHRRHHIQQCLPRGIPVVVRVGTYPLHYYGNVLMLGVGLEARGTMGYHPVDADCVWCVVLHCRWCGGDHAQQQGGRRWRLQVGLAALGVCACLQACWTTAISVDCSRVLPDTTLWVVRASQGYLGCLQQQGTSTS